MKPRRRKLLVALVAAAIVGWMAFAGWRWLNRRPHRINAYSASQIEMLMTPAEVEAILGVPPGDYTTRGLSPDPWALAAGRKYVASLRPDQYRCEEWLSDDYCLWVVFDLQAGGVVGNHLGLGK